MKSRRDFLAGASGLLIASAAVAPANEPWQNKKPNEWSGEDVQTILNHSPWVRDVSLEMDPAAVSPEKDSDKDKTRKPHRKQVSGLQTDFRIVVRWESGLPVVLARRAAVIPDNGKQQYVLSLGRLPLAFFADSSASGSKLGQSDDIAKSLVSEQILKSFLLQRDTKGALPANKTQWVDAGFTSRIMITFLAGEHPIRMEDQEVTLAGRIGSLILRARFSLKAMTYRGNLEI